MTPEQAEELFNKLHTYLQAAIDYAFESREMGSDGYFQSANHRPLDKAEQDFKEAMINAAQNSTTLNK